MSISAKTRILQVNAFLVTLNGRESWTLKTQDRKSIEAFEDWCWRRLWRTLWIVKKSEISISDRKSIHTSHLSHKEPSSNYHVFDMGFKDPPLSWDVHNAGKYERKEQEEMTGSLVDGLDYSGGECMAWNLSMWLLRVSNQPPNHQSRGTDAFDFSFLHDLCTPSFCCI